MVERVRKVVSSFPELRFAALFGSRARGDARADSDADLGLSFRTPPPLLELGGYVTELEDATGTRVDLVELEGLPSRNPLLAYRIATEGKLVYEAEAGAFDAFRALAYSMYFDAEPFLNASRQALLDRIRGGGFGRPVHA